MTDFSELNLDTLSSRATVLATSWPQIREITLHPYLDDPDFTSKHSFVIVIQHNASFHAVEEGKFLEHVGGFLPKKSISNKQYDECLIWPIGPDEPFPEQAVKDVSTTLYKREGTTEDEVLSEETPEEKQRKKLEEQRICDKERDECFGRRAKGTPKERQRREEKEKEMAARLLLGRKPVESAYGPNLDAPMTAEEEARYWKENAREAMKPSEKSACLVPEPKLEPTLPQTPKSVNFFTKESSGLWHVGFEGQATRITHLDGFEYISLLLERPGKSMQCVELCRAVSKETPARLMSECNAGRNLRKSAGIKVRHLEDEGLYLDQTMQPINTPEAKAAYGRRYRELATDLSVIINLPAEDITPEDKIQQKQIESEMTGIIARLKERNFVDDNKKSQINVKARMEGAYKALAREGMKRLEKHLRDHIRTDGSYGLVYNGSTTWEIPL